MRLFKAIPYDELNEGDLVQFYGVHALRWGNTLTPSYAFIELDDPLYSAAPALLEACEALLAGIESWKGTRGLSVIRDDMLVNRMIMEVDKAKGLVAHESERSESDVPTDV